MIYMRHNAMKYPMDFPTNIKQKTAKIYAIKI